MAIKLADVLVGIKVDSGGLDRGLQQVEGRTKAFGGVMQGVMQGIGQRLFDASSGAVRGLVGALNTATDKASDLNETVNKTSVVFGKSASDILEWSQTTDTALGQSQQQALDAAGSFGNLFTSMGIARDEAANMSRGLVELASDLASFNNIDPTEALEKLRSGIVGETEPLRALGVFLNESVVASKAAELGFGAVGTKLNEQQKVLARYAVILGQTTNAQGDFARTSTSLANATRVTAAQFENLQTTVGQAFLPIKTAFIRGLGEIVTAVYPWAQQIIANFARGLASAVRAITPALMALRALFSYWLRPGSPPALLPDLVEWGRAAAEEWISGWSAGDISTLQDLGSSIESILRSFVGTGDIAETDLVSMIFGSQEAIADAINEFREFGEVSEETIERIREGAGPAGDSVANLVSAYFDLAEAAQKTADAQQELNDITAAYDEILSPLQGELTELQRKQKDIRLQQEEARLKAEIADPETDALAREAARLRLDEIALQRQIDNVEEEKDAAVDAAEEKVDAAKEEEAAAQAKYDAAEALVEQQVKYNDLLAEQLALEEQIRQEEEAAAEAAAAEAEAAAAAAEAEREAAEQAAEAAEAERQALAEQAQAEADAIAAALLQYQLGLTDTQGKLALLRAELAKTQVGSVEYYNLLGQISALEAQSAAESQANAEELAAAQERYQMQVGDTSSDLELLRKKLAQTKEGSVEYFDILTEIAAKEQELANQRATNVAAVVESAAEGIEPIEPTDLLDPETQAAIDDLVASIESISDAAVEITPGIQHLGESFDNLITIIGELFGIDFTGFTDKNQTATDTAGNAWDHYGEIAAANTAKATNAADESAEHTAQQLDVWASNIKLVTLAAQGDWSGFWEEFQNNTRLGMEASNTESRSGQTTFLENVRSWIPIVLENWGQFFADMGDAVTSFFSSAKEGWDAFIAGLGKLFDDFIGPTLTDWGNFLGDLVGDVTDIAGDMFDAGVALLESLWDGLKEKWDEIMEWWSGPDGVWTRFRDVLPFSEPKDPNSPLRGLGKSGESIFNQIQSGMDKAALDVTPLANAIVPGASANNDNRAYFYFDQMIGANGDMAGVKEAARRGVLDARRARGL